MTGEQDKERGAVAFVMTDLQRQLRQITVATGELNRSVDEAMKDSKINPSGQRKIKKGARAVADEALKICDLVGEDQS